MKELIMANSTIIPLLMYPNLQLEPRNCIPRFSKNSRNSSSLASASTRSENFSTTIKTHQAIINPGTRNETFHKATLLLQYMDFSKSDECTEIYTLILQKCKKLDNFQLGLQLHAHLNVLGVELCPFLGTQLLELYCKCGSLEDARKLFDKMPERNVFSYTSIMGKYCGSSYYLETVDLFFMMIDEGIRPDHFVFPKVFKACSELRDYKVGKKVYEYMMDIGFEGNASVQSSLLDMFVKCRRIDIARKLFKEMKFKHIFLWNIMVSGYASKGDFHKAFRCLKEMKLQGVIPDQITWNSFITGYTQNGKFNEAVKFFSEMVESQDFRPNVVSWTALITGYEQNGYSSQALYVFKKMILQRIKPNSITMACVISACSNLSLLKQGKEIHCYCIKSGYLDSDLLVDNSLTSFYAKCRANLEHARRKFDKILYKDLVSWNAMLAGYALRGHYEEVIELLEKMEIEGVEPDTTTWNGLVTGYTRSGNGSIALEFFHKMCKENGVVPNITTLSGALSACAQVKNLSLGKGIHGYVIRHQVEMSTGVGSAIISMYSACDSSGFACSVFEKMQTKKDVIIWNSIISACAQSGNGVNALNLLRDMVSVNIEPDMVTMVSVIPACSRLAALRQGKEIHQFIIRHGLDISNFVSNALIDMYGRSGSIEESRRIFDLMKNKDIVSWTVMISVYGMHGFGTEAISLFEQLRGTGLKPSHITFTNLLSACSHSGLIDQGREYFEMMTVEYSLEPAMEQYACMVDIMARSGRLGEAVGIIKQMPFEPNVAVWGSLLGACRIHCNPEIAEYAANNLFELEPLSSGNYILLANIYAASGRWEDAAKLRCLMRERGVIKTQGCSWIEVRGKVHNFIAGGMTHPLFDQIRAKMERLYLEIKEVGYVPDTKYVLQKVEEEEKEFSLCGHSEKLALAFGLISTAKGTPLRIIKNLRTCGDCHSATKFISMVEEREIIMRDNYRFHHFANGVCSCGDYW